MLRQWAWLCRLASITCLVGSLNACIDVDFGNGGFQCASDPNDRCPEGFVCTFSGEIGTCVPFDPSITILDAPQTIKRGETFTIRVGITAFNLDDNSKGGTNQQGVGHYHVYLGAFSAQMPEGWIAALGTLEGTVTVPQDAELGPTDLHVALANNNHTLVDPDPESGPTEVSDKTTVTVLPGVL